MKKEMNFAMITKMMGAMRNRLNNGESIFFVSDCVSSRVKLHKYYYFNDIYVELTRRHNKT